MDSIEKDFDVEPLWKQLQIPARKRSLKGKVVDAGLTLPQR